MSAASAERARPPGGTAAPASPAPRTGAHSDWEEDEAPPASRAPTPPPPGAAFLQLSDRLPVLDARLSPGRVFDLNLLTAHPAHNDWQKIPNWLAGVWRCDQEIVAEEAGFRMIRLNTLPLTVRKHESRTFGMQRDRQGAIWQYTKVPYLRKHSLDGRTEFRLETTNLFVRAGVGKVINFVRFIAVRVEDSTDVILDTRQQENLCLLTPMSDKKMKIEATMRVFDTLGRAATTSGSQVVLHRVSGFTPLKQYRGENMPALFQSYLRSSEAGGSESPP